MGDANDQVKLNEAIAHLDAALEGLEAAKGRLHQAMHLSPDPYDRGRATIGTIQPVRWWRDELAARLCMLRQGTAT